jgi:hypothetical protein
MKLDQLLEKEIPNPLGKPPQNMADILNYFDEVEADFRETIQPKGDTVLARIRDLYDQIRKKGSLQDVDISKIIPIEPLLDDNHIQNIISGSPINSSSKLPWGYLYNNKIYLCDGNHRVAADKIRGNKTTKMIVIDIKDLI